MTLKIMCIQFQPELNNISIDVVENIIREIADDACVNELTIQHGDDNGRYINFIFETNNLYNLWSLVSKLLNENSMLGSALKDSMIVTCEGEQGWDDYLILHHFDSILEVDNINDWHV